MIRLTFDKDYTIHIIGNILTITDTKSKFEHAYVVIKNIVAVKSYVNGLTIYSNNLTIDINSDNTDAGREKIAKCYQNIKLDIQNLK